MKATRRQFAKTVGAAAGATVLGFPSIVRSQKRTSFKMAWSIYTGWMPWEYARRARVLSRWADRYGIQIELERMKYIPSLTEFSNRNADAVVATNMDCYALPVSSGVDSTVMIMGDYSNGNDAILTRDGLGVEDLRGRNVYLVEGSVSEYLLSRCLEMKSNFTERDVSLVNADEDTIAATFINDSNQMAVVTWNPMVMLVAQRPGVRSVCTSADIPGEILDLCICNTQVLEDNPDFGRALTGAWYEVMGLMSQRGNPSTQAALNYMAEQSGADLTEYQQQLTTTAMFYRPGDAAEYTDSAELKEKMDRVRRFTFEHGWLGQSIRTVDTLGIEYPDGTVQGDRNNVLMRFNSNYMRMAEGDAL